MAETKKADTNECILYESHMKFWDKQIYSKGEQISDFIGVGFGGGWSWGAALSAKGHREIWGEREMFCFFDWAGGYTKEHIC